MNDIFILHATIFIYTYTSIKINLCAAYTPVPLKHRFQKHFHSCFGGAAYTPVRLIHRKLRYTTYLNGYHSMKEHHLSEGTCHFHQISDISLSL